MSKKVKEVETSIILKKDEYTNAQYFGNKENNSIFKNKIVKQIGLITLVLSITISAGCQRIFSKTPTTIIPTEPAATQETVTLEESVVKEESINSLSNFSDIKTYLKKEETFVVQTNDYPDAVDITSKEKVAEEVVEEQVIEEAPVAEEVVEEQVIVENTVSIFTEDEINLFKLVESEKPQENNFEIANNNKDVYFKLVNYMYEEENMNEIYEAINSLGLNDINQVRYLNRVASIINDFKLKGEFLDGLALIGENAIAPKHNKTVSTEAMETFVSAALTQLYATNGVDLTQLYEFTVDYSVLTEDANNPIEDGIANQDKTDKIYKKTSTLAELLDGYFNSGDNYSSAIDISIRNLADRLATGEFQVQVTEQDYTDLVNQIGDLEDALNNEKRMQLIEAEVTNALKPLETGEFIGTPVDHAIAVNQIMCYKANSNMQQTVDLSIFTTVGNDNVKDILDVVNRVTSGETTSDIEFTNGAEILSKINAKEGDLTPNDVFYIAAWSNVQKQIENGEYDTEAEKLFIDQITEARTRVSNQSAKVSKKSSNINMSNKAKQNINYDKINVAYGSSKQFDDTYSKQFVLKNQGFNKRSNYKTQGI